MQDDMGTFYQSQQVVPNYAAFHTYLCNEFYPCIEKPQIMHKFKYIVYNIIRDIHFQIFLNCDIRLIFTHNKFK